MNRTIGIDFGFLRNDTLPCQWGWGTPDLNWHTYTIYRSQCTLHPAAINRLWLTLQFFPSDTTAHGGAGEYLVDNLRFCYSNGIVVVDGFGDPSLAVAITQNLPTGFRLEQNYPNPFNPNTIIHYQLPMDSYVVLTVYDVLGRDVATLANEVKQLGTHAVQFSGKSGSGHSLAGGVYFYRLEAGRYMQTRRMVLLR